jgi:Rrf2 family protein
MVLSQTAEYALRAVLYVAREAGEQQVRVVDAAEALAIPQNYLSKILHLLARGGLLRSTRGKSGGFQLARPADQISLWSVVQEFDRMPIERRCLLGRPTCTDRTACAAHSSWKATAESLTLFFRRTSVADLLRNSGDNPRI